MRPFYLLGVLTVLLTGCGWNDNPQFKAKVAAQEEIRLLFVIRDAQAKYETYLRSRADECKTEGQLLVRDQDGILVCVTPPKKTEEKQ